MWKTLGMFFIWAFLWFLFFKASLLKTYCLVLPGAWGKARAGQGCGTRNAAPKGMQGCITASVDFKDQFSV